MGCVTRAASVALGSLTYDYFEYSLLAHPFPKDGGMCPVETFKVRRNDECDASKDKTLLRFKICKVDRSSIAGTIFRTLSRSFGVLY